MSYIQGFLCGSDSKESAAMWETQVRSLVGKIPWRSFQKTGIPLEFQKTGSPVFLLDGLPVHVVTKNRTQLSN